MPTVLQITLLAYNPTLVEYTHRNSLSCTVWKETVLIFFLELFLDCDVFR